MLAAIISLQLQSSHLSIIFIFENLLVSVNFPGNSTPDERATGPSVPVVYEVKLTL